MTRKAPSHTHRPRMAHWGDVDGRQGQGITADVCGCVMNATLLLLLFHVAFSVSPSNSPLDSCFQWLEVCLLRNWNQKKEISSHSLSRSLLLQWMCMVFTNHSQSGICCYVYSVIRINYLMYFILCIGIYFICGIIFYSCSGPSYPSVNAVWWHQLYLLSPLINIL